MGYCIEQIGKAEFLLIKQQQDNALQAIQALHGKETIKDSSGSHFCWVKNDFYKIDNIKDMLEEWRWEPEFDDNENIIGLEFTGEKLGDDSLLFRAIAPFVLSGEITMRGEDAGSWQWIFADGELKDKPYNDRESFRTGYGGWVDFE